MSFELHRQRAPGILGDLQQGAHNVHEYFSGGVTEPGTVSPSTIINPATEPKRHLIRDIVKDLASQAGHTRDNVELLASLIETEVEGGYIDDRKYQIEQIIQLASRLPSDSPGLQQLTGILIGSLWDNLQHPPISYLGDDFQYRSANGYGNNPMYPHLGVAGGAYARTVTPKTELPGVLPDPSLIFDSIFARGEKAREHPNKISSVLFYVATIIIHDLFRTDDFDHATHATSSYLDLAPLYGNNIDEQQSVRTMEDGMLKPDAFAEIRLLAMPPGVCALLVCFNRFHNYVAAQLAIINERGQFDKPQGEPGTERYEAALRKRDKDLFETARLVTCGLYVNIILNDYVRTILNLNRGHSEWSLDPRKGFSIFDKKGVPQGVGNAISVEFNLVYRWHSAISARDEEWTKQKYKELFGDIDPDMLSPQDVGRGFHAWAKAVPTDPGERTFGGLARGKDGKFDDETLVKFLADSTLDVAGAFGARNVPVVMKAIEVMGMEQARKWKVATLNEFRKFFKLQPHRTFESISSDKDVQKSLEALYGQPDYVELYPGLVVEDAKKKMNPGSGLCPGYTVSRTILSDAVALVRGDRFYTVDYTPANLTSWGYNQAQNDTKIAGGGVMYKLLMRAFPSYYRGNSVFAMFPLVHPEENRKIFRRLGVEKEYNYDYPSPIHTPIAIHTWKGVTSVLADPQKFNVPWGPHTSYLTHADYMLSSDDPKQVVQKKQIAEALYGSQIQIDQQKPQGYVHNKQGDGPGHQKRGLEEIRIFYEHITTSLIQNCAKKLRNTYQLDAVRDVGNPSHAVFVANVFKIPLKNPDTKFIGLTAEQLYQILGVLFAYVFIDLDTANSFALREGAKTATDILSKIITLVVGIVKVGDTLTFHTDPEVRWLDNAYLKEYGVHLIKRLLDQGKSVQEVVAEIIPTAAAAVATQGQGFAHMLELYLSPEHAEDWKDIQRCAASDEPEDFERLKRYGLEALRLSPPAFGLLRTVAVDEAIIQDGDKEIKVHKNDSIYVDFVSASRDENIFAKADTVCLDRDPDKYLHHGYGSHACLGRPIVEIAMATQLRVFARLKNLRLTPGGQGKLKSQIVPPPAPGKIRVYMKEDWGTWWPFPVSMKVLFDEIPGEHELKKKQEEQSSFYLEMQERMEMIVGSLVPGRTSSRPVNQRSAGLRYSRYDRFQQDIVNSNEPESSSDDEAAQQPTSQHTRHKSDSLRERLRDHADALFEKVTGHSSRGTSHSRSRSRSRPSSSSGPGPTMVASPRPMSSSSATVRESFYIDQIRHPQRSRPSTSSGGDTSSLHVPPSRSAARPSSRSRAETDGSVTARTSHHPIEEWRSLSPRRQEAPQSQSLPLPPYEGNVSRSRSASLRSRDSGVDLRSQYRTGSESGASASESTRPSTSAGNAAIFSPQQHGTNSGSVSSTNTTPPRPRKRSGLASDVDDGVEYNAGYQDYEDNREGGMDGEGKEKGKGLGLSSWGSPRGKQEVDSAVAAELRRG